MGGDHGDGGELELGDLGRRSIDYAERDVEGCRPATWDMLERLVADHEPLKSPAMVAAQVADMDELKRMIARAFVLGWAARDEEHGRRGRALGGVADDLRRKARHANAPRRPSRRRTEGNS